MSKNSSLRVAISLLRLVPFLSCGGLVVFSGGAGAQIFVVNQGAGTIGKYATSGATINASFISGLSSPTGIAVSGDYLYVAQENGTIRKYTTAGTLVNAALITGLYLPLGLAVSGDFLYVANGGGESSTIGKYTTAGATVNAALVTGLGNPTGLAVSGNDLYVTCWHTGNVGKYTIAGATINAAFATGMLYPGGLTLDNSGYVYISSLYDGVRKYTTGGVLVNNPLIANSYNSAMGLAYDGNGHLLVANNYGGAGGNIIGEYTTTGAVVNANFITGLKNPVAIAVVVPEPRPLVLALFGLGGLYWCGVSSRVRAGGASS